MIYKYYEIDKINITFNKLILFYGKNEGLKEEAINNLTKQNKIFIYDEKEILDNQSNFIENILSRSLFEKEKIIIIKRITDKILKIIEELSTKNIEDIVIILNAENLEKKSK